MVMKRYFTICLLVFSSMFFSSCSKINLYPKSATPYHHGILKNITDTMTNHPEHALSMLKNIDDIIIENDFAEQEYHEYQILLSEANYKNFYNQTNHKEVIDACKYFDSLTSLYPQNIEITFLYSRAQYYKAVGLEELENPKDAFKNYLQALETIDKINTNKKNGNKKLFRDIQHFKALIYTRLGDLLYWHDIYDSAIACITNANSIFYLENDINGLSRNNIILAIIYGLNLNHDKALQHLEIADSLLKSNNLDESIKNELERTKASVMYNIGYKDEAFNTIMRQYKTLDDPKQIMEIAGILGDMYYNKKDYDSAIYYYEQYFPDNKFSKINAANNIIEISIITGNNELITKYAPSLAEETNKEIMLSSIKTEFSSLYNQYNLEKENYIRYNEIFRNLISLSLIIVATFIFGLFAIRFRRRKYTQEISQKSSYINSLQKKVEKTSSENKHIKLQIKNLEEELLDIKNKNRIGYVSFEQKIDSIKDKEIYKKLYDISTNNSIKTNTPYPDLQLSNFEQKELIELFNTTFDNGLNQIISEHHGLKYYDLLYFCLYIIGLDEKHISAVTGKTYNAVWNRTKKIQEILGSDKKIKDIVKSKLKY